MKCASCGYDNPQDKTFCKQCGSKIAAPPVPDPDPVDLQERIKVLKDDLLRRDEEIKQLNEELDKLKKGHPEVETHLRQLNAKDRALQDALEELDRFRPVPKPQPIPPGPKTRLLIESHPIPNPAFGITFNDPQKPLDLSATGFRIRASLERNSDGSVGLSIHPGATINIKIPGEKRWRRLEGGARLNTEAGMLVFDPDGVMNARLDWCS